VPTAGQAVQGMTRSSGKTAGAVIKLLPGCHKTIVVGP
jgi:hypothetical protein